MTEWNSYLDIFNSLYIQYVLTFCIIWWFSKMFALTSLYGLCGNPYTGTIYNLKLNPEVSFRQENKQVFS